MKKNIFTIKHLFLLVFALALMSNSWAQNDSTYFAYPTDDGLVRAGDNADENYNDEVELYIKNAGLDHKNSRFVKLKFDLHGMSVNSADVALVRLYCTRAEGFPITVNGTGDAWSEDTLTFNNAPAMENSITVVDNSVKGAWTTIDISDYVMDQLAAGDSLISIELVDSTFSADQIRFHSKEADTLLWPVIVIAESMEDLVIAPPTNLEATSITLNSIELAWDATESDIPNGGYHLYNGDELLSSTPNTSISLTDLDTNTYFDFYLTAADSAGLESEKISISTSTLSLYNPLVDVYVKVSSGDDNFEGDYLYVKKTATGSNNRKTLLKFDITYADYAAAEVAAAKLKLYCITKSSGSPVTVYNIADSDWTGDVTWNTAPTFGDSITSFTTTKNEWVEIDLTDYVKSMIATEDTIAIGIFASEVADDRFHSVEYLTHRPKLYILGADDEAPAAPVDLTANADTVFIDLSWGESTDNVGIEHYLVYNDSLIGTLEPNELSYTVTGLDPATEYQFLVKAEDFNGNLSDADTVDVLTLGGVDTVPPTSPTDLTVYNIGLFSASATWAPSSDNYELTGYIITLDGDSLTALADTASIYTFIGLSPNTEYTLGVKAFDAAGNQSEKATEPFKTTSPPDYEPPTVPENLAASDLGDGSVELTWDESTDNLGTVSYIIYDDTEMLGNTNDLTYTITDLSSGDYTFYVSAIDNSGNESDNAAVDITVGSTGINDVSASLVKAWTINNTIYVNISGSEKALISIFNIQGSLIHTEEIVVGQYLIKTVENKGMYLIQTTIGSSVSVDKVVVR